MFTWRHFDILESNWVILWVFDVWKTHASRTDDKRCRAHPTIMSRVLHNFLLRSVLNWITYNFPFPNMVFLMWFLLHSVNHLFMALLLWSSAERSQNHSVRVKTYSRKLIKLKIFICEWLLPTRIFILLHWKRISNNACFDMVDNNTLRTHIITTKAYGIKHEPGAPISPT